MARMLVGGVGYRFMRDLSFGPLVVDRIRGEHWLTDVEIEDLSYAPVAIAQRWMDSRPGRLVLVGAVARGDRPAGTICRYCPTGVLPDPYEIQLRVGEALTGIISLDNLLVVSRAFGALPRDVEVLEIEPADSGWGDGLSTPLQSAVPKVIAALREIIEPLGSPAEGSTGKERRDAVENLRQRDDLLQVLYWMEGEGLASDVRPVDLLPFLEGGESAISHHLNALCRVGYVEPAGNETGRYRLTVIGRQEGRRRFTEEFAPLLRQGHGECNDPECDCHITGEPALCVNREARG